MRKLDIVKDETDRRASLTITAIFQTEVTLSLLNRLDRIQGPERKIGPFIQHLTTSHPSFTHQVQRIRKSGSPSSGECRSN